MSSAFKPHHLSAKTPDESKKQKIQLLNELAGSKINVNNAVKARAAQFRESNIKLFDSLHLASAEYANVDVLLTTDAKFLKAATHTDAQVRVANPLTFFMEVINDGQFSD